MTGTYDTARNSSDAPSECGGCLVDSCSRVRDRVLYKIQGSTLNRACHNGAIVLSGENRWCPHNTTRDGRRPSNNRLPKDNKLSLSVPNMLHLPKHRLLLCFTRRQCRSECTSCCSSDSFRMTPSALVQRKRGPRHSKDQII